MHKRGDENETVLFGGFLCHHSAAAATAVTQTWDGSGHGAYPPESIGERVQLFRDCAGLQGCPEDRRGGRLGSAQLL